MHISLRRCVPPSPAGGCHQSLLSKQWNRTKKQQIQLLHGHDAHDGGDAAPERKQASKGVAGDAPERPGRTPGHFRSPLPGQAGHVQPLQVVQEAPLRKSQVPPSAVLLC